MATPGTLDLVTPTDREVVLTRDFDAQPQAVFEAYSRPELLQRWLLGPPGMTMPVCEVDLRVGGALRFAWRLPDGNEMTMRGTYREVEPPTRLVHTESWDIDWAGKETLVTTALEQHAGGTRLTLTLLYESREVRDAVLGTGMRQGLAASYDRLAGLLAASR